MITNNNDNVVFKLETEVYASRMHLVYILRHCTVMVFAHTSNFGTKSGSSTSHGLPCFGKMSSYGYQARHT